MKLDTTLAMIPLFLLPAAPTFAAAALPPLQQIEIGNEGSIAPDRYAAYHFYFDSSCVFHLPYSSPPR